MLVSLDWIKDYVKLPDDMDLKKLAYDLTMSTVEVEDTIELARQFDGLVVGVIKAVNPHPYADKLRVCTVDIGGRDKEIVCGGSNLYRGEKVVVALPGAMVKWHGEGDLVEIKESKLRGVDSYGMICASSEIGLGDLLPAEGDHVIADLANFDCKAGQPIAEVLDLDDIILEIDNKSMTNRPDLWGHYGIAREISALYNLPLVEIPEFPKTEQGDLDVRIGDEERCRRYLGVEIDGLYVKEAPYKMQNRIWKVGMRPINALVDVTNYVMLAVGQPTHAFDSDNISDYITARRAKDGEKLVLLNNEEIELCSDDLVIADSQGPVGLAGVMGGAKDSILPTTKNVILEIANFEPKGIRRTTQRYQSRTEASARYEKGIDIERIDMAYNMTMAMFKELYPEMRVVACKDLWPVKLEKPEIDVSLSWLDRRLGGDMTKDFYKTKLELLGFKVSFDGDNMHVCVPSWRATGDISMKADIMEEVARMYGYDNYNATTITTTFDHAVNQLDFDLVRKIKEYLAFRCNMQEIFSYPWMHDKTVEAVLGSTDGILKLSTPPSPTEKYIRSSLLPNLCDAVAKNERFYNEFAIFEDAQIFQDHDYTRKYDEREAIPYCEKNIAGAFVGNRNDVTTLFRKAKGIVEMMPRYTHMEGFTFKKDEKPYWADNTVWLNIYVGDTKVGNLGLLSKKASMGVGIKAVATVLFELNIYALKPFKSRTNKFEHLAEFPEIEYDISMLFDSRTKWEKIYSEIMRKAKSEKLIKGASFVDEYHGAQVPRDKKSVTIRLVIGSNEKTLTSSEIEKVANSVMNALVHTRGGEIRTK